MNESELAEAALEAGEALRLDLSDPDCFAEAEEMLRSVEAGVSDQQFDVPAVRRFLGALAHAASERGVPPSQLWSALDALERC